VEPLELKCHPEPFEGLWSGRKPYEVRRADRPYAVGLELLLREWEPRAGRYTGREVHAVITWITPPGSWGLPEDLCVLGIRTLALRMAA
jgi:hypothetical protein